MLESSDSTTAGQRVQRQTIAMNYFVRCMNPTSSFEFLAVHAEKHKVIRVRPLANNC